MSERAGGAPPGAPRPQHSPHHDGDEEGDAQEQAAPRHQEGVGVGDGTGAGFQDSSCGAEGTGARLRDWSGGGAAPHKAPSPRLTSIAVSSIVLKELGRQRGPVAVGTILCGELQEPAGGTRWDGAAPSSAVQGDILGGGEGVTTPRPTCEL